MFKMLWDTNFTYDSSMPIYENRPPSWPYTLDYKLFHDCMIPPCPTRSYPGLWEVPMVMWQDLNGGRCSMGDACSNPPTPDGVYKMLIKNFERHYTTNRLVKSDRSRAALSCAATGRDCRVARIERKSREKASLARNPLARAPTSPRAPKSPRETPGDNNRDLEILIKLFKYFIKF